MQQAGQNIDTHIESAKPVTDYCIRCYNLQTFCTSAYNEVSALRQYVFYLNTVLVQTYYELAYLRDSVGVYRINALATANYELNRQGNRLMKVCDEQRIVILRLRERCDGLQRPLDPEFSAYVDALLGERVVEGNFYLQRYQNATVCAQPNTVAEVGYQKTAKHESNSSARQLEAKTDVRDLKSEYRVAIHQLKLVKCAARKHDQSY